jgi:hypothetical protein
VEIGDERDKRQQVHRVEDRETCQYVNASVGSAFSRQRAWRRAQLEM